jgi:hypothetical protein
MSVNNCAGSLSHGAEDKPQCLMLSRVLLYVVRLLDRYPKLDNNE